MIADNWKSEINESIDNIQIWSDMRRLKVPESIRRCTRFCKSGQNCRFAQLVYNKSLPKYPHQLKKARKMSIRLEKRDKCLSAQTALCDKPSMLFMCPRGMSRYGVLPTTPETSLLSVRGVCNSSELNLQLSPGSLRTKYRHFSCS